MNKLIVFTDGGARGNPGPGAIGIVIKGEKGEILGKICRTIGKITNNVAEYSAVVAALEWIKDNKQICKPALPAGRYVNMQIIQFYLDSVLVVNQLNGLFKVKDSELRNLLVKVRMLENEIGGNIIYTAIPREQNWQADELVNEALDEERR